MSQRPSSSKMDVLTSSRFSSTDQSVHSESLSSDQSRSRNPPTSASQSRSVYYLRSRNQSSQSRSKELLMSSNHSPLFTSVQTPPFSYPTNNHVENLDSHNVVHRPLNKSHDSSQQSPIRELQQWIDELYVFLLYEITWSMSSNIAKIITIVTEEMWLLRLMQLRNMLNYNQIRWVCS